MQTSRFFLCLFIFYLPPALANIVIHVTKTLSLAIKCLLSNIFLQFPNIFFLNNETFLLNEKEKHFHKRVRGTAVSLRLKLSTLRFLADGSYRKHSGN